MLKVRIIPTLLWKDVGLVKGIKFDSWRRVGTIMPAIKVYNMRQVDELIVVDITAAKEKRAPDYQAVSDFSAECFVPLTVGGGICNLDHVKNLLRAGADKVCVNSCAFEDPGIISKIADAFGSQCVVASIDVKRELDGTYQCYSYSGTKATGLDVTTWAQALETRGAGEIIITSIDRDGTMGGYDVELIKMVTQTVSIPVIASGGVGNYQHMYDALAFGGASAVAAASIFHFTQQTPLGAKRYLADKGIPVRI
jgi:imidazole glycerol-phosphate synthase subunit HisF